MIGDTPAFGLQHHIFGSAFGEPGSGPGQLAEPSGIAVNDVTFGKTGDVYVVDAGNARVQLFSSEGKAVVGQFDGSSTPAGSFSSPSAIAIDNSTSEPLTDPSTGDVYVVDFGHHVVDKFSSEGAYIGQIATGAGGSALGEIDGIAVDGEGNVWLAQSSGQINSYSDAETNQFISVRSATFGAEPGFGVDSEHDLYLSSGSNHINKLSEAGNTLVERFDPNTATAVAVELTNNHVFIDEGGAIGVFESSGNAIERFGEEHLFNSQGVTVDASDGVVYATNRESNTVSVFTTLTVPDTTTGDATNTPTEGAAELNGVVNPLGLEVAACSFEYGLTTAYGSTAECHPQPGNGTTPVPVVANLTGLEVASYHYRLVTSNENGQAPGLDRVFVATGAPVIASESTSQVRSSTATISATINPGGLPTTYSVEFGTSTAYGASTELVTLAAAVTPVGVQVSLSGLQPSTQYHARVRATNQRATAASADAAFTTTSAGGGPSSSSCPNRTNRGFSPSLPDCRAWELVSAAGGPGEVFIPEGYGMTFQPGAEDIPTERPMRASALGDAVSYVGEPGEAGGTGSTGKHQGDQFIAIRNSASEGWDVNNITAQTTSTQPHENEPIYESLSGDLSAGIFTTNFESVAATATPRGPESCEVLYSRTGGAIGNGYHALFSASQTPGFCGFRGNNSERSITPQNLVFAGGNEGTSDVAKYSHLLVQTPAALTVGSELAPAGQGSNLYISNGGELSAVNVLTDGTRPPAVFGGPPPPAESTQVRPDYSNVISADGSTVFWTDVATGRLYARLHGTSTIPISKGPAQFYTATPDGRFALYVENERLWRGDAATGYEPEDLAGPGVQGVVGADEALSDIYFVDGRALTADSEQRLCSEPAVEESELTEKGELTPEEQARLGGEASAETRGLLPHGRGCNLYVFHEGTISFTGATLAAKDDKLQRTIPGTSVSLGDWQSELGARTAAVSKDGNQLVFESTQRLSGYDNSRLAAASGKTESAAEVFVYDAEPGRTHLVCASCAPGGTPPSAEGERGAGTYLPVSMAATYMRRWMSADGSRVFFDTSQPLVPQDTNGTQDVYEWEREGTEGCRVATSVWGGCVFLLSDGSSSDLSFFVDASASGDDVFLTHRGQLGQVGVPDGRVALFDVRAGGGQAEHQTGCAGTGCEAVSSTATSFATPSTATFAGIGNISQSAGPKPKTAAQIRAEHLAKALRTCRAKRTLRRRRACEAQARKRYGPTHRAKRSTKRKAKRPAKRKSNQRRK